MCQLPAQREHLWTDCEAVEGAAQVPKGLQTMGSSELGQVMVTAAPNSEGG